MAAVKDVPSEEVKVAVEQLINVTNAHVARKGKDQAWEDLKSAALMQIAEGHALNQVNGSLKVFAAILGKPALKFVDDGMENGIRHFKEMPA
jgi:hypothetical protein